MSHFNYNGKLYPLSTAVIGAGNRGLRYGDGLFETMKMRDGNILCQAAHFDRLWKGMGVLQFEIPRLFTKGSLVNAIKMLAVKNGHEKSARIRLNVFRGDGGLFDAVNLSPQYMIETWHLNEPTGTLNSNGLVVGIFDSVYKSCDLLANIKHNNYLPYVLAALHAKTEKWNDAILLNQYGRVADSCIANIFIIKDNRVFTPALSEGPVAGTIRQRLIDFFQQKNIDCLETEITKEALLMADELFFTNSIYDMRWVQRIGDHHYGNRMASQIYSDLIPTIC